MYSIWFLAPSPRTYSYFTRAICHACRIPREEKIEGKKGNLQDPGALVAAINGPASCTASLGGGNVGLGTFLSFGQTYLNAATVSTGHSIE